MSLSDLDLLARGAGLALLALLAFLLLRDHHRAVPARMAVALAGAIACYLIVGAHGLRGVPAPLAIALVLGEATISGFFWLFVRSWFNDEVRFGWVSWLTVVAVAALSLANYLLWRPDRGGYMPTQIAMHISWLALPIIALRVAWRGRDNDLIEARRRLRSGFVWATGIAVVLINIIHFIQSILAPGRPAPGVALSTVLVTLGVAAGLCCVLLRIRRADIFLGAEFPTAPPPIPLEENGLAARLQAHMLSDRTYRDETLTIAALALHLGVPEYRLRRTINGQLGFRNFSAFLNTYRLGEVTAALSDPAQRRVPILTIALDAGFGSLASFNRAFRERERRTPSAFRAAALIERYAIVLPES